MVKNKSNPIPATPIDNNNMKLVSIKNVTLQILELYQTTERGPKVHYVGPGKIIVLPESGVSQQIKNLVERRMLKAN